MTRIPRNVKSQECIKALERLGFIKGKGKGSHVRLTHPNGHWTQVAVHPKPIPPGTLRAILHQAGISLEQFLKAL